MAEPVRRSTLALAVLALLAESPMHPYRMQQLIRERGKDKVVNVGQRASLYKVIERLMASGLVVVRGTSREQRYPERTVYELTNLGRQVLLRWMREALAEPEHTYPEFPAVLSFLPLLSPEEAAAQLEARAERLRRDVAQLEADLDSAPVARLFLIEDEYRLAQLRSELSWVRALIGDLRSGKLTWTEEWVRAAAGGTSRSEGR
ncbi:MAG TPA: PadR family transcriptional regulator [Candidatus Limnocylindrales bacterium]|jgi:DNA-binding PadR family transcriptional regulator|nr:PadR family transcriptional regulator [Candidatus Limnocylindrales bacterium]